MEQLYAPPDHMVFTLVPPTFHERAMELYLSIGELEVTVGTFWDIYRDLLGRLRELIDDQLTEELNTFQANLNNDTEDMALLPNMELFCLGQPLNLGASLLIWVSWRRIQMLCLLTSTDLGQSLHYLWIPMIAVMRVAQMCHLPKLFPLSPCYSSPYFIPDRSYPFLS